MKYGYDCTQCGYVEVDKGMNAPDPKCPNCSGDLKRVYSAPGLQFVGTGWTPKHFQK